MDINKYELAKKISQLEGLTNEEKASLVELLRSQKKHVEGGISERKALVISKYCNFIFLKRYKF